MAFPAAASRSSMGDGDAADPKVAAEEEPDRPMRDARLGPPKPSEVTSLDRPRDKPMNQPPARRPARGVEGAYPATEATQRFPSRSIQVPPVPHSTRPKARCHPTPPTAEAADEALGHCVLPVSSHRPSRAPGSAHRLRWEGCPKLFRGDIGKPLPPEGLPVIGHATEGAPDRGRHRTEVRHRTPGKTPTNTRGSVLLLRHTRQAVWETSGKPR